MKDLWAGTSPAKRNLSSTRESSPSFDGNRTDFPGGWFCASEGYKGMHESLVEELMDLTMHGKLDWVFVPSGSGLPMAVVSTVLTFE